MQEDGVMVLAKGIDWQRNRIRCSCGKKCLPQKLNCSSSLLNFEDTPW